MRRKWQEGRRGDRKEKVMGKEESKGWKEGVCIIYNEAYIFDKAGSWPGSPCFSNPFLAPLTFSSSPSRRVDCNWSFGCNTQSTWDTGIGRLRESNREKKIISKMRPFSLFFLLFFAVLNFSFDRHTNCPIFQQIHKIHKRKIIPSDGWTDMPWKLIKEEKTKSCIHDEQTEESMDRRTTWDWRAHLYTFQHHSYSQNLISCISRSWNESITKA